MTGRSFDVAVVGKGLIGSAAARRLSEAGMRTAVIGPDEPEHPARHDGPFASHYDEGRLTHRSARNVVWSQLAARAMAAYADIEARSGLAFHQVRGTLTLERGNGGFSYTVHRSAIAAALGFSYEELPTAQAVAARFPLVACPPDFIGLLDPAPSGFINPRTLLRAQLTLATRSGAQPINDTVIGLAEIPGGVQLRTAAGAQLQAAHVLLATGAHLHSYGLRDDLPALTVKSEVVTLAEVAETDLAAWQTMPSMMIESVDPAISDLYLVPPVRYPDGRWYLKLGSNAADDRILTTHETIVAWMRHGDTTYASNAQTRAIRQLFPQTAFGRFAAKRCMISRTPHGLPYIDRLTERVTVAAGCNGSAAKSADAIAELATLVVCGADWPAPFRRADFQLPNG